MLILLQDGQGEEIARRLEAFYEKARAAAR